MICPTCQREIADYSNFCYYCGTRLASGVAGRRLMRSVMDSKIAGVCGGFAEYFNIDPTVMRILVVFVTIATGLLPGIVAYVVAWILMPQAPYISSPTGVANTAAPGSGQR
jgi:phage shock protein C